MDNNTNTPGWPPEEIKQGFMDVNHSFLSSLFSPLFEEAYENLSDNVPASRGHSILPDLVTAYQDQLRLKLREAHEESVCAVLMSYRDKVRAEFDSLSNVERSRCEPDGSSSTRARDLALTTATGSQPIEDKLRLYKAMHRRAEESGFPEYLKVPTQTDKSE